MKARYQIKEDAKELIKTNNLWLSIGLIQTILGIFIISIYFTNSPFFHNDSSGFAYTIPSLLSALFQLCVNLYLQNVIENKIEIKKGFINQLKDIINSLTLNTFLTDLISNLFLIAWAIIPFAGIFISIVKSYSYGLSIYIANNQKDNNYTAYITNSRFKMDGHKMAWFMQHLSFIPWLLLTVITGGLANLYVYPYMTAADVIFANQVLEENKKKDY